MSEATMQRLSETTLLKVGQVAQRWSISRSSVYELMDSGRLASVKILAARRIPLANVVAFEEALKQPAEEE